MDLYCPTCNEPVDNDYFHDVAAETDSTYREVAAQFRMRGCEALGDTCNPNGVRNPYAEALYDLLGDDMDGAASMMADYPDLF